MINFVLTTLSITLGIVLASVLMVVIMLAIMMSPKVMKWYTNFIVKVMNNIEETFYDENEENQ